jgi:hypothetical protein
LVNTNVKIDLRNAFCFSVYPYNFINDGASNPEEIICDTENPDRTTPTVIIL